jgi:hypothetical protein
LLKAELMAGVAEAEAGVAEAGEAEAAPVSHREWLVYSIYDLITDLASVIMTFFNRHHERSVVIPFVVVGWPQVLRTFAMTTWMGGMATPPAGGSP